MALHVHLTADAESDLRGIGDYIAESDSLTTALYVLDRVEERIDSLKNLPERGAIVRELLDLGSRQYREVRFGPYRIIYRVTDETVNVHLIADGRRDMQTLLLRRLLGA